MSLSRFTLAALLAATMAPPAVAARSEPPPVASVLATSDTVRGFLGQLFGRSGKVRLVPLSTTRALQGTSLGELFGGRSGPSTSGERAASDASVETLARGGVAAAADGRARETAIVDAESPRLATVVPLIPFSAKRGGMLRGYRIGWWPSEPRGRRAPANDTPLPEGFIEVHAADTALAVSDQFHIGDFLTKDQHQTWPKYLVLKPELLDKLELISARLEARGLPSRLRVMSGFRTPQYNAKGVGRRGGRAKDSRHMYGDASDVFVDADADGRMDDLDRDGRITLLDAMVLADIADEVEQAHPELVGGVSAYKATPAHGPFVHVDVRGHRARW